MVPTSCNWYSNDVTTPKLPLPLSGPTTNLRSRSNSRTQFSVCSHDLCGEEIVTRKSKLAVEPSETATESHARLFRYWQSIPIVVASPKA